MSKGVAGIGDIEGRGRSPTGELRVKLRLKLPSEPGERSGLPLGLGHSLCVGLLDV